MTWTLYINPDDHWSDAALTAAKHGHAFGIVKSACVPHRQAFLVNDLDEWIAVEARLEWDSSDVREGWK